LILLGTPLVQILLWRWRYFPPLTKKKESSPMVKKALQLCMLAAGLALLDAGTAAAQTIPMEAFLTGAEETPAPGLNTGAFGYATVDVDLDDREVVVNLEVFNLPTGSTAGHIHAGAKGTPGPVILDFSFPAGRTGDMTLELRLGQAAFRSRGDIGVATLDDAIQAIVGGNAYVNIHTSQYPGGEIRGQITRRDNRGQGQQVEGRQQ
jgi:hypothetical protein